MKSSKTIPFFLGILIATILITPFIQVGHSVSYYNWIRNSSFEINTNMIEDNGFESGQLNSGVLYGNWTDNITYEETYVHSGVYAGGVANFAFYNFTTPILGADIESFTLWIYHSGQTYYSEIMFCYTDGTNDELRDDITPSGTWMFKDVFTDYTDYETLNQAKYVSAIGFARESSNEFIDDLSLTVYTGDNVNSQDEIVFSSTPWHKWEFGTGTDILSHLDDSSISGVISYLGEYSYHFDCDSPDNYYVPIAQSVNFLNSSSVIFVDCYVNMTEISSCYMNVAVQYSDGTISSRFIQITDADEWVHVNFGSGFITDNKMIVEIRIQPVENSGGTALDDGQIYIDDVGIWCDVPSTGLSRFMWTLSPPPINGYNGFAGSCYTNTIYTFHGWIYDVDGELTESGTYYASSSISGTWNGNIASGSFVFTIPKRTSEGIEHFGITINIQSQVFVVDIVITWWGLGTPTPSGGTLPYSNVPVSTFVQLILILVVLLAPSLVVMFECSKHNYDSVLGFLGTFNVMAILGTSVQLINIWILIAVIIVDVFLGMMALHQRGYV